MISLPQPIAATTPVLDTLRNRVNLGGANVPIVVRGTNLASPRYTAFTPEHVSSSVSTGFEYLGEGYDTKRKVVTRAELTIQGVFQYEGDTDRYARVHVLWQGPTRIVRYTDACRSITDMMPEGARKLVSDAVVTLLGDIDWEALSIERQVVDNAQNINAAIYAAERAVDEARRAYKAPAVVMPLVGSPR